MRPQVKVDPETEKPALVRSAVDKIIDRNISVETVGKEGGKVPIRSTTLDAHLGAALIEVTARVHYYVSEVVKRCGIADVLQLRPRGQYQALSDYVRFRPSGARPEYFKFYCARINAGGWYGGSAEQFPSGVFLRRADLRGIVVWLQLPQCRPHRGEPGRSPAPISHLRASKSFRIESARGQPSVCLPHHQQSEGCGSTKVRHERSND